MSDYKSTLNLPHTDFPMRGNLAKREPEMLKKWQENYIYQQQKEKNKGKPVFTLHDGPPYANGKLHMGHALNKILKDIIVKSQQQQGKFSDYIPGWDCHGLPIELKVEEKYGKVGDKISAKDFRKACRNYAQSQIEQQKEDFIRLGVFGRWDKPYKTMDFETEAGIVRTLAKIVANGDVDRGSKPVNWCTDCGSALAEAEVEYQNKTSHSIYVSYPAKNSQEIASIFKVDTDKEIAAVMWTTTPWTLPSSYAMSLHPELEYGLYQSAGLDKLIVIANDLAGAVQKALKLDDLSRLATVTGEQLENQWLQHPYLARDIPILVADHVTIEAGTGCVHTAPAHGLDDYNVAVLKYGIDYEAFVDAKGIFMPNTEHFAGQFVFKANDAIIEKIKEHHNLLGVSKFEHSYPHCWRHKTPTIFRATSQWFVSMDNNGLRKKALAGINDVKFIPEWGQARLYDMIEKRPDWCISRQRYWGVPLCFIAHKETGQLHPNMPEIMNKVADKVAQKGIEAWFELELSDLIASEDLDSYEKINDVLDVWFDSGSTHESVVKQEETLSSPADLYLEGSDQHRGWFHSSLLTSSSINDQPPYKSLLTHGFVVDEKGLKMSKSLGNIVEPQKVINTLGADILRLWVASTDYTREISLSDNILKHTSDAYRRIRNTARFLLSNIHDFEPQNHCVDSEHMLPLDRYIVSRALEIQDTIETAYNNYQFNVVYQSIHHFCSIDLGSFYLDVIKDRQYTINAENIARRSAQTAMYHVLEAMVRWMAPILSFTADEIWGFMPRPVDNNRASSVFLSDPYGELFALAPSNGFDKAYWLMISKVREFSTAELEKQRAKGEIGSSLDAELTLFVSDHLMQQLSQLNDELRFVLMTSDVILKPISELENHDNYEALDVLGEKMIVLSTKSKYQKCERCWHYRKEVGEIASHPTLCQRCVDNIDGDGEKRLFA